MDPDKPRGRWLRPRVLAGTVIVLAVAGSAAALLFRGAPGDAARGYTLVAARRADLVATVGAAGQLEPERTVNLSMAATSRVAEVYVAVGDRVRAGQPLARADDRQLRLQAAQAEAALAQARASYDQLRSGAATGDIQAARAQLEQARGQLLQVQGGVTEADLVAAQAQLQQAQAALALLTSGPKQSDLDVAQARVRAAELGLQGQRDQLSAAKTNAQIALEQATNALTQAQSRYSTASQNWEYVQGTGADPIVRRVADPSRPGQTRANTLNDSQRQQYYDAFVQAEAALRTAENNVAQAQVAYENTLSAERTGVERAEGELSIAQAQLGQLRAGADADQLAAARAQVAAARASLAKLGGEQRAGALQAAQAAVALAEARLSQLESGPQPAELAAAEAQVESAQAQFDLARLALEEASLVAPFDGEIAEVGLRAGELPSPGRSAVTLADLSRLHVTVTVDEVDIAKIQAGQPVSLTLDALPDASLSGTVASIAPLAQPATAVTSYAVRITITSTDARVRPGMSTNADILVDQRAAALVVPRRAVRSDRGRLLVDVARDPGLCSLPPEQLPAEPALETREVRVGLSNEQAIEILSGVDPADCIRVEGVDARLNLLNGPPGPRR